MKKVETHVNSRIHQETSQIEAFDDRGIFIVGNQRSGTTLLRIILDSHPDLCAGEETAIIEMVKKLLDAKWSKFEFYGVPRKEIYSKIKNFFLIFHHSNCRKTRKKRWVDKSPDNILCLDFINTLFPECKVIHIIRDGRDVAASYLQKWGFASFFCSLYEWPRNVRLGRKVGTLLGEKRYIEIFYEDLVTDPRAVLLRLASFLDIEFHESLMNHAQNDHSILIHKKTDTRPLRPIDQSRVGSWPRRLSWYQRVLVRSGFHYSLKKYGYIKKDFFAKFWRKMENTISHIGFIMGRILPQFKNIGFNFNIEKSIRPEFKK